MLLVTLAAPACAKAPPQRQPDPQPEALPPVPALPIQPLAGKTVGVLPLTLLVADPMPCNPIRLTPSTRIAVAGSVAPIR